MKIGTQQITIDIGKNNCSTAWGIKGDIGTRELDIFVVDNDSIVDLTNLQVLFYSLTSTGKKIYTNVDFVNAQLGQLKLVISQEILNAPGTSKCCLLFREGEKQLVSFNFTFTTWDSVYDEDAIVSSDDFSALTKALNEVDVWNDFFKENSDNIEEKYTPRLNELSSQLEDNTQQLDEHIKNHPSNSVDIICTFNDAYVSWCKGEKFPIAFYGDSTVDGYGTTGFVQNVIGVDSKSPNSFCKKLESKLRTECGNNILRIYNAGFTGQTLTWGVEKFESIFGGNSVYSDAKMIGLGFGINDRLRFSNFSDYRKHVIENTETLIKKCIEKNIQPFLVTTQATSECGVGTVMTNYVLRDSNSINVCANEVKRELAKKYNLQLIDINKFTELFLMYSNIDVDMIIPDRLHFADLGHDYESGLIFNYINPRVIQIHNREEYLINYSSQRLKNAVPEDRISYGGELKVYARYTKNGTNDIKIMDCYVFITDKTATLRAYKLSSTSSTYVKIDGLAVPLHDTETILNNLDLGLHHLEVFTGTNAEVDFSGFIINKIVYTDGGVIPPKEIPIADGTTLTNQQPFQSMDSTIVPACLGIEHDKATHASLLSNLTLKKIKIKFANTGTITIGKCDLTKFRSFTDVEIIDAFTVNVTLGMNEIDLNLFIGENETLCVGAVGDTAKPYYGLGSSTTIYTHQNFKQGTASTIGLVCSIYKQDN